MAARRAEGGVDSVDSVDSGSDSETRRGTTVVDSEASSYSRSSSSGAEEAAAKATAASTGTLLVGQYADGGFRLSANADPELVSVEHPDWSSKGLHGNKYKSMWDAGDEFCGKQDTLWCKFLALFFTM
jgi:hypothetical protein